MCACRKPDGFVGRCWIWLDEDPVDSLLVSFDRGELEAMALVVSRSEDCSLVYSSTTLAVA